MAYDRQINWLSNNVWYRKQASPDYKIIDVFSRQIGFFLRVSVVHEFGQKFEISLCLYLGKIGLGIVFGDVLDRK